MNSVTHTTVRTGKTNNPYISPKAGEGKKRIMMKKMMKKWENMFRSRLSEWNLHHKSLAAIREERMRNELQYRQSCNDLYAMQDLKIRRID